MESRSIKNLARLKGYRDWTVVSMRLRARYRGNKRTRSQERAKTMDRDPDVQVYG